MTPEVEELRDAIRREAGNVHAVAALTRALECAMARAQAKLQQPAQEARKDG